MTKIFEWLENNAGKIILTVVLAWGLFFGILYVQGIQSYIVTLQNNVAILQEGQTDIQATQLVQNQALLLSLEMLEELQRNDAFIIEQNRAKADQDAKDKIIVKESTKKPSYEELKSHTVYIVGCSDKVLPDSQRIEFMLGNVEGDKTGMCWSGTGSVVKITDKETYIITNNHVSGKNEPNVTLYVQNGKNKLVATIVKQNEYVDAAVIKIQGKLEGKTEIPGYATTKIQEPVYIVGNPLGNKMTYSEGVVANFLTMDMLIQAPLIYGNSGSAIINKDGKMVGMCYALQMYPGLLGLPFAQITHSLCVDSISVQTMLKDLGLIDKINYE